MQIEEIINQLYNLKLEEIKNLKSEDLEKLINLIDDLLKISMTLNQERRIK
jgi:ADP-dependent phosphofructokinase/glucokinase